MRFCIGSKKVRASRILCGFSFTQIFETLILLRGFLRIVPDFTGLKQCNAGLRYTVFLRNQKPSISVYISSVSRCLVNIYDCNTKEGEVLKHPNRPKFCET